MDRRTFMGRLGAVGALAVVGGTTGLEALSLPVPGPFGGRVGIPRERIGLQLYTVRDLMAESVEATLEFVAQVGYREVEFAGYFDRSARSVRATLDGLGLRAPSMHTDLGGLSGLDEISEAAQEIGHEYVVVAWIPPEDRTQLDDYRRIAALLNDAGERLARSGLQLAFHNHDYVYERLDGEVPYDVLLEECDADLVAMQADLFWMIKGGVDPVDYFRAWPGRFPSCHVKDMSADGRMVSVGDGVVDFDRIFESAELAGLKHYFVEHDDPDDSREAITRSFRHLTSGN